MVEDIPDFWKHSTSLFSALFFGGRSCLKMSPRLIVTFIRHLHAVAARIADHKTDLSPKFLNPAYLLKRQLGLNPDERRYYRKYYEFDA
jgi:hypothetical protein